MSKRILTLILALTLIVGVLPFAQAEQAQGDLLARIQAKGEIVIATEGAWSPWTYHNEDDQLVGFDVEVAQRVADKLGVKATFVESEWEGIFAGLESKRYDIAANGIEVTDERAEKYNFSTPYGYIRTALVVRGDNDSIAALEDLKGKKTVNSIASTYMLMAEEYGAEVIGVDTLEQTIEMVLYGRADATLNAEVSVYDYLGVHPDANIKIVCLTDEASMVSIPVRKDEDSATLLEAIDAAIEELRAEGVLAELSIKYFGSDITAVPVESAE